VSHNLIQGNLIFHNQLSGLYLSSGADHNMIFNNEVQTNNEVGIAVAGVDNLIVGNQVHDNTLDIADLGEGNRWQKNTYTPSVGWATGTDATGAPAISYTTDGGRTWQAQGNLPVSTGDGTEMSAVDDQTAWATVTGSDSNSAGTILHTSNGGASWVAQTLPDGVSGGIKTVKGLSRNEAWAASLGGTVLHTTDGGVTWNIVDHSEAPIAVAHRIEANSQGDVWIANVDYLNGGTPYVIHSPDNGLTWRQELLPDVPPGSSPLSISPFSPQVVWSAVNFEGALYRTMDGGAQWFKVARLAGQDDFDDLCAASPETVWGVLNLSGNSGGRIFRVHVAVDGAVDHQEFNPTPGYQYEGVTCLDDRIAWIVGYRSVSADPSLPLGVTLFTINGGETWVKGTGATDVAYWKTSFVGARR